MIRTLINIIIVIIELLLLQFNRQIDYHHYLLSSESSLESLSDDVASVFLCFFSFFFFLDFSFFLPDFGDSDLWNWRLNNRYKSLEAVIYFFCFVKRYLVLYNSCSGRLPVDKCIPLCWQYIKKAVVHIESMYVKTILRSIDISTYNIHKLSILEIKTSRNKNLEYVPLAENTIQF